MADTDDPLEQARGKVVSAMEEYAAALRGAEGARLGEGLIKTRELKDRVEAIFVEGLTRFDRAGDYAKDGALDVIAWLRSRCKVSGSDAAQRVGVARQLEQLPMTQRAFAAGELGLQHVAVLARAAEHVGGAVIKKAEGALLAMAEKMDPGQFTGVVKNFEHQVDAQAALAAANRAHQRRYLYVVDQADGMVKLDGLLDAEGGAVVRNALISRLLPAKDDQRTPAQRRADALVQICEAREQASGDGSGPRPQLVIMASVETWSGASRRRPVRSRMVARCRARRSVASPVMPP